MDYSLYEVTGLSENIADHAKNYETIISAIEICRKNGLKGLKLPEGAFAVYNDKATELSELLLNSEVSATDYAYWQSHPNVLFDIDGFESFTVAGNDTTLLFDGLIGAFDVKNTGKAEIEGVTVDWITPLFFTGRVSGIVGNKITVITDQALKGNEPIVSFQNFDCITGHQKGMSAFCDISNVCREDEKTVSFESKETDGLSVGDGIIARYIYGFAPVMHFYESKNISIRNTVINAGCGMGIIAHKCEGFYAENFRVFPSGNRPMSTNTDATHFISCTGRIRFNNCMFEGMGDDAVNVHGFYIGVKRIIDRYTVVGVIEASVQDGIADMPDAGDIIEFCSKKTLLPFANGILAKVEFSGDAGEIILKFKGELPDGINADCCLANASKTAELVFENCSVKNIRGRALLIQTRNVVVRNNVFSDCTGQGIHIDTAAGWWESIGTRNIEISENKFINCGYGMTKYCDAVGIVIETEAESDAIGVHRNIVLRNNRIEGKNTGIKAKCVENLELKGNRFIGCKTQYDLSSCKNVKIN